MGVGMALFEETSYDQRNGKALNSNLADYVMTTHADSPQLDVVFLDYPDLHLNAMGARGVGEIGLAGIAAAITAPSTTPPACVCASCRCESRTCSTRRSHEYRPFGVGHARGAPMNSAHELTALIGALRGLGAGRTRPRRHGDAHPHPRLDLPPPGHAHAGASRRQRGVRAVRWLPAARHRRCAHRR